VNFEINRNRLDPGLHVGIIEVRSNAGIDSVFVTVPQDEGPRLSVSADQLNFDIFNTAHTITVDNTGGGILSWEAGSPDNWVYINPDHGDISTQALSASLSKYNILTKTLNTSAMQVEISVAIDQFDPGEITSQVNFTSNGGSHTIELIVDVAEHPELSLSTNELNFGSELSSLTFDIINSGNGILDWTAEPSTNILTVTPQSGSTQTSETVTVDLDRSQLDISGDNNFTISIQSDGGNAAINVLANRLTPAELSYSPAQLEFGVDALELPLTLTNLGELDLNWEVNTASTWLILSPQSGTLPGTGGVGTDPDNSTEVLVKIDAAADLAQGTHTAEIEITSNGGDGIVIVTYIVPENPVLVVDPVELNFGYTDNVKEVTIAFLNAAAGDTYTWTASTDDDWITLQKVAGSAAHSAEDKLIVTVVRSGKNSGDYLGNIEVNSNYGTATIEVKMSVASNPVLTLSKDIIDFGTDSNLESFYIKNGGNDEFTWSSEIAYVMTDGSPEVMSTEAGEWLSINPLSGTTSQQTEINVYANRDKVDGGVNKAIIHIYSDAGNADVEVKLTADSPLLDVSTQSLNFGSDLTQLYFDVINNSGQVLNWSTNINYGEKNDPRAGFTAASNWLSVYPDYGTTTDRTTVTAAAARELLDTGVYRATISVLSEFGNKDISVEITILPPDLDVRPDSLDFGTSSNQKTFNVINEGGGILQYSVTTEDQWIFVEPEGGYRDIAGQDVIKVTVDRGDGAAEFSKSSVNNVNNASEIKGTITIQNIYDENDVETVEVIMTTKDK
ncbi:hypothetical protein ACFLTH_16640, partial [Bacteroidota bacterium]